MAVDQAPTDTTNSVAIPRGGRSPWRPVIAVATALGFAWITGPLTVAIATVAVVWAPALDRRSLAGGLARAVLLVGSYGAMVMVLLPLTGLRVTYGVSFASVVVLALVAIAHRLHVGHDPNRWRDSVNLGTVAGPALLLSAVLVGIARFGSVPAWAMGGDARNHVLWTNFLEVDGGWTSGINYPAFANVLGAWLNAPADGLLLRDVQSQALLWLLFLCTFSLLSGMVASQGGSGHPALRAGVGSLVTVSPLVLGPMSEGFFPVAWVCLVTLSVATAALSPVIGRAGFLVFSALGILIVAATYPPMAPVCALVAIGARAGSMRPLVGWSIAGAAVAGCALALKLLTGSETVVSTLSLSGASLSYSELLLTALVTVAFLNYLSHQSEGQWSFLVALGLGLVGLVMVLLWLDSLSEPGATAYYWSKTLVVGFCALLPLAIGSSIEGTPSTKATGSPPLLWLAAAGLALGVANLPILFASAPKLPVLKIAQGWFLPSGDQAGLVFSIQAEDLTAAEWGTYDPETDRRINIWLGSGRSASGDRNLSDEGFAWAYGADMVGLNGLCTLAANRPEIDVYVDTSGQAELVRAACKIDPDRVRTIGTR